jgi:hypothetical protein
MHVASENSSIELPLLNSVLDDSSSFPYKKTTVLIEGKFKSTG